MDTPFQLSKRPKVGEKEPVNEGNSEKRPEPFVYRRRHVNYQRHGKPPYTYLAMMVVAIETSPEKRIPLADIQTSISKMFPFFEGEYQGWRDSVRHNLSHNPCFVKTNRTSTSKTYLWTVDLSLVPTESFKRIKSQKTEEINWAPTLTQHLQIPDIELPDQTHSPRKKVRSKRRLRSKKDEADDSCSQTSDGKSCSRSLLYTDAQYTRYLREQTPAGNVLPLNDYPTFAALLYDSASDVSSAASNLYRLCPSPQYGTPVQEAVQRDDLDLSVPKLCLKEEPTFHLEAAPSTQKQLLRNKRARVEDTPSPEISPSWKDPFTRYFADCTTIPETPIYSKHPKCVKSNEEEQSSSNQQILLAGHMFFPGVSSCSSSPRFEPISPVRAYRYVLVDPPSDCSTISCVSELSQLPACNVQSVSKQDSETLTFNSFFADVKHQMSYSDLFC